MFIQSIRTSHSPPVSVCPPSPPPHPGSSTRRTSNLDRKIPLLNGTHNIFSDTETFYKYISYLGHRMGHQKRSLVSGSWPFAAREGFVSSSLDSSRSPCMCNVCRRWFLEWSINNRVLGSLSWSICIELVMRAFNCSVDLGYGVEDVDFWSQPAFRRDLSLLFCWFWNLCPW